MTVEAQFKKKIPPTNSLDIPKDVLILRPVYIYSDVLQGCTYYTVLVLTGPLRGTIWNIDEALSPPLKAPFSDFLDYYEGWINRMLARESQFWYGYPRTEKLIEWEFILDEPITRWPERV